MCVCLGVCHGDYTFSCIPFFPVSAFVSHGTRSRFWLRAVTFSHILVLIPPRVPPIQNLLTPQLTTTRVLFLQALFKKSLFFPINLIISSPHGHRTTNTTVHLFDAPSHIPLHHFSFIFTFHVTPLNRPKVLRCLKRCSLAFKAWSPKSCFISVLCSPERE